MTDPAAIASRLTDRQREALLWLFTDSERRWNGNTNGLHDPAPNTMRSLCRAHLANFRGSSGMPIYYRLLPLGQRVRAAVEAGQ